MEYITRGVEEARMQRGQLAATEITLVAAPALRGSKLGRQLCAALSQEGMRHTTTASLPLPGLVTWHRHPPLPYDSEMAVEDHWVPVEYVALHLDAPQFAELVQVCAVCQSGHSSTHLCRCLGLGLRVGAQGCACGSGFRTRARARIRARATDYGLGLRLRARAKAKG
jgi:hypothetical protein